MNDNVKTIWLTAWWVDQKLKVDELTYTKIMIAKTSSDIFEILLNFWDEKMLVKVDDLHILQ